MSAAGAAQAQPSAWDVVDAEILAARSARADTLRALQELERTGPGGVNWGAVTAHQSQLALARRALHQADVALHSARMRAFVLRMERVRAPSLPAAPAAPEPAQLAAAL